jgi:hypothetical protein
LFPILHFWLQIHFASSPPYLLLLHVFNFAIFLLPFLTWWQLIILF